MGVSPYGVLCTFPVTQQVLGLVYIGVGIAAAVAKIAKIAFSKIQLQYENHKAQPDQAKIDTLTRKITISKEHLKTNLKFILAGVLTIIPVVGTIINGMLWSRQVKEARQRQQNLNLNQW
jgi:hypothetical protein